MIPIQPPPSSVSIHIPPSSPSATNQSIGGGGKVFHTVHDNNSIVKNISLQSLSPNNNTILPPIRTQQILSNKIAGVPSSPLRTTFRLTKNQLSPTTTTRI
jgi:hypothetical protein